MKAKNNISALKVMLNILKLCYKSIPGYIIINIFVSLLNAFSLIVIIVGTQRFFDMVAKSINTNSSYKSVLLGALLLGVAIILNQVINCVHNIITSTFTDKISGPLGMLINEKTSRIDPVLFEDTQFLDDINRATEGMKNSLRLILISQLILSYYVPYFIFMALYLFTIKPLFAILVIFIFFPVLISQYIRQSIFSNYENSAAPLRREFEYYEKCIASKEYFKETRLLGAYPYFKKLFDETIKSFCKKNWQTESQTVFIEFGLKLITLFGYLAILFVVFNSFLNNEISVGAFSAIFASISNLFAIMEEVICRHIGTLSKGMGSARNFIRFLNMTERTGNSESIDIDKGILLKDVSFKYPNSNNYSVQNINFELNGNETVAIVGKNGSGKTTLAKVILGIYTPTGGDVIIGGANTKNIHPNVLYMQFSAVFQKFQKYKMTLYDNVEISEINKEKEYKRVEDILVKTDFNLDKEKLNDGINTMISREFDGIELSGGQWQKIAISRGLYRKHNMIFLDEPTASIDPLEESKIYKQFIELSKNKMTFIISHRFGTAKFADKIIVMDNGSIIEMGSHGELMKKQGMYFDMFTSQSKPYID